MKERIFGYMITEDLWHTFLKFEVDKTYHIHPKAIYTLGFEIHHNMDEARKWTEYNFLKKNIKILKFEVLGKILKNPNSQILQTNKIKIVEIVPPENWQFPFKIIRNDRGLIVEQRFENVFYPYVNEFKTFSYKHKYNDNGDLILENVDDDTYQTSYYYDDQNRLIRECGKYFGERCYFYDDQGLLIKMTEFDERDESETHLEYDEMGNLINDGSGINYTYNDKNQIISERYYSSEYHYEYDDIGNRVKYKSVGYGRKYSYSIKIY